MCVTEADKAYAAGLIDGEGSILLTRSSGGKYRAPVVSMTNTSRELIDFMLDTFGGHVVFKEKRRANWRDAWVWTVRSDKCLLFLRLVLPYLRESNKVARAQLILSEYKAVTARNGKYSEARLNAKNAFEARFMSI